MEQEYIKGLVSVIIPCYNVAPYVLRCLNSILNNTYQKLELVCVDDGSTDNTLELLHSVDDKRVIVVSQTNQGVSDARNVGLAKSHGEYISFVDPDDWVHKDFISRLLETQRMTDADVAMCDYIRVDDFVQDADVSTHVSPILYRVKDVWSHTSYKNYVWRKLYKRSYVANCRFLKEASIGEDMLYNVDTIVANPDAKYAVIGDKLLYYFSRPDSIIRSFNGEDLLYTVDGLSKAISRSNSDLMDIPAIETIKFGLSARYLSMFEPNYEEIKSKCSSYFNFALKHIKGRISKKDYIKYLIFVNFPFLYRRFRIMTDGTLLEWEEEQKSKHLIK